MKGKFPCSAVHLSSPGQHSHSVQREEEDLHLEKMVQQRLRLSAKVILDDLPVEPVQDEFPG